MQDRLRVDGDTGLILAQSLGLQSGNLSIAINRTHEATREWQTRTTLAVCLPHEMKFDQGGKVTEFVQQTLAEFGYGRPDCRVWRYWEDGFPLKTSGANMHGLVMARDGKAMIALGNYGPGGAAGRAATGVATDTDTEGPSLEDYDAVQRGLKPDAKPDAKPDSAGKAPGKLAAKAETYTVRLTLDLAALGLAEDVVAYDAERAAGHTKTANPKAVKPPQKPGDVEPGEDPAGALEEESVLLRRIAPGVFELQIATHDFALIGIADAPPPKPAPKKPTRRKK